MPLNKFHISQNIKIIYFDMDHTIIHNDCDLSWKIFLKEKNIVGLRDELQGYWHFLMYRMGKLNQKRFFDFQLKQFQGKTFSEMQGLLEEHFSAHIKDRIFLDIIPLLAQLKSKQVKCVLLTATCEEIARPLARYLGMDGLIGTRLQMENNKYTGRITEPWCGGENKIKAIIEYNQNYSIELKDTSYWGDNITDAVVLKKVGHPVACNPSPALKKIAQKNGWQIIELDPGK
jgi:HAD superfamily hydrolase (TIGR01490 family)